MFAKILFLTTTTVLLMLGFVSSILAKKSRTKLGCIIGDFLRIIGPSRKKITLENIRKAFPTESQFWQTSVAKDSYRNLGITLVELLALKKIFKKSINEYIKYDNLELIDELKSRGKGLLLLSGHFGNWELLAFSAGYYSKSPITIIVKPQRNYIADRVLNKYRCMGGNQIISMYGAARTIVKTMKNKDVLALLADQSATSDKDVYVDFFGIPAATYEAPAALALKYKCPIIVGFAVRMEDSSYRVKLEEIKYDDLNDDREGIIELTKRHVAILEKAIRENPGLWAWQHRRWKHTMFNDRA